MMKNVLRRKNNLFIISFIVLFALFITSYLYSDISKDFSKEDKYIYKLAKCWMNKANNLKKAVPLLDELLKKHKNKEELYFDRGISLFYLDKFVQARADFQKAMKLNPKNSKYKAWNAQSLMKIGIDKKDEVGILALKTEFIDPALATMDEILEKDPDNEDANLTWAEYYMESPFPLGDMDKAFELYQKVYKINKNNMRLHVLLGKWYKKNEQYSKSVEEFNIAQQLFLKKVVPRNPITNDMYIYSYLNMAKTYKEMDDKANALKMVNYHLKLKPSSGGGKSFKEDLD